MSWATRRQTIILSIVAVVILAALLAIFVPLLYKAPSCTDQKQNGDEVGVDCGGSCAYLCSAGITKPSVKFARPFSPSSGRTDVIAYVENPNSTAAAKNVGYTLELYDMDNAVIAREGGVLDLPPQSMVPVYVPNLFSGYRDVARAFLLIDDASVRWFRYEDDRILPRYNNDASIVTGDTPRITVSFRNPTAEVMRDILVIVTVYDGAGNAIAASRTIIPQIGAQGVAGATVTWNAPFSAEPVRVDAIPLIPLPAPSSL